MLRARAARDEAEAVCAVFGGVFGGHDVAGVAAGWEDFAYVSVAAGAECQFVAHGRSPPGMRPTMK